MITFFCCTENVKLDFSVEKVGGYSYQSTFDAIENLTDIKAEKIYFCAPDFFESQLRVYENQYKKTSENVFLAIDSSVIQSLKDFPKNIGFDILENQLQCFSNPKEFKVAIIGAMSPALGDSLVALPAFNYWRNKILEIFPDVKITISFFQVNPYKLREVNKQYDVDNFYTLPSNLTLLLQQDAYIDLGILEIVNVSSELRCKNLQIQRDFQSKNLVDFFLQALSIHSEEVPNEYKRISYKL